jgi:hypothetical protein
MLRNVLLLALLGTAGIGQTLEVGVAAGIPVTSAFETGYQTGVSAGPYGPAGATSATRRYTVGPMIGVQLPRGFGVEFDALYRRLGFDQQYSYFIPDQFETVYVHVRTTAGSWDLPLLGRYQFRHFRALSPSVKGGVSFRDLGGVSTTTGMKIQQASLPIGPGFNQTGSAFGIRRSTTGGVVGLGLALRLKFLQISPEVRYTRWGADRFLNPLLSSNQNQVDVLVGIAFLSSPFRRH